MKVDSGVIMQKSVIRQKYIAADVLVLLVLGTVIYALIAFGREWKTSFHPATVIDLSFRSLPYYTLFSAVRGMVAFALSLMFTLVVGYWAAKSPKAEKVIIPILDILQSIPVLGFLPGLVLALIALFPRTNTGLELSSIIMIFTGQVWNMTFSYYSSLKSVPTDLHEVSKIIGLSAWQKLKRVEFPFSAMNLVWNSLLSMSGGWFFLSVCEAFTLGNQEYRLPGLGAYMAVAIAKGDTQAMVSGITAMVFLIVGMDILIWRPVLAWAHQFRLEESSSFGVADSLIRNMIKDSLILRWVQNALRKKEIRRRFLGFDQKFLPQPIAITARGWPKLSLSAYVKPLGIVAAVAVGGLACFGFIHLIQILTRVSAYNWAMLIASTGITLLRVVGCLILSSLWAVPVGIWIGTSPKRTRRAQPIIQVMASFPAPMLYPIALALLFAMKIHFVIGSMFLMLLGVQWYVLFNVLAGAMRIPNELRFAASLMKVSRWATWRKLYIPSVFPALVTGWVTAAGGAWNASIVAEYIPYRGEILATHGLGSAISVAAAREDFPTLAASLSIMVVVVIVINRTVWEKIYHLAYTRFRLDV
jgi:NitT/TauT family transport system permease protein